MALFDHFQVGFIAEMEVSFLEVPRIKRMEANVVKAFFGYRAIWVISQNAIEIIVVTPRKQHVVQPAIPLIDPVLFAGKEKTRPSPGQQLRKVVNFVEFT